MKNKMFYLSIGIVLILSTLACSLVTGLPGVNVVRGSGESVQEERPVSGVGAVDLAGLGQLNVTLGDSERLLVIADDNLLPYIETEVRGGTLYIGIRRGVNLQPRSEIRYELTVPGLDALEVSGLGSVNVPTLEVPHFQVGISGSGDVHLDGLQADSLDVNLSGLGSLSIGAGELERMSLNISGSGNLEAEEVSCREADVNISGLGSTQLHVTEHLQADISGSGSVRYYGDPDVDSNVSGLGSVQKLDR